LFPISIFCPQGSFVIESKNGGCLFTATLTFRFEKLLLKFAKNILEAIRIHLQEEGANLKKLLEK
jgi:hypothetical protein